MKQYWRENLQEHRTTNSLFLIWITNLFQACNDAVYPEKTKLATDNVNAYFNFKFKTGAVEHQVLTGYDGRSGKNVKVDNKMQQEVSFKERNCSCLLQSCKSI
ncbi:hypothetical protein EJ377_17690 [Chryseobacterium arthrosphaerae]|uniref:Lipoprotein n=1 Tax=Chryseobacterium arthrosphaerae TaxID=651561 RepID=A0A3S0VGD8_9FLAO|nr:hypothetical protein EJ377_17690 [Chryseobacterium arthrosphaerae]